MFVACRGGVFVVCCRAGCITATHVVVLVLAERAVFLLWIT